MPKTDVATAQAAINPKPATRTRLTFPKPMMVPGSIGVVQAVVGVMEGGYLFVEGDAARARNARIHVASLAILEDLPPKAD